MSVYSRWVEARGTTSMLSTPAAAQPSKPVRRSRIGSGPFGDPAGTIELPPARKYGATVKPYSDWIASAGTVGVFGAPDPPKVVSPLLASLSSATTVSTRGSVPWTCDTAAAPRECPMIAILLVRPGVTVWVSGVRSSFAAYGLAGERNQSRASSVPVVKLASCWNG